MRFFKIILFALIGIMAFFSIFMIIDFFFGRRNFRNEDVSNIYKDGVIKNTNKADSISRELSNLKSIENIDIQIELEHLKNQAFCDLQWKLFTSNSCVNDDASGYMHISNLDIKYFNVKSNFSTQFFIYMNNTLGLSLSNTKYVETKMYKEFRVISLQTETGKLSQKSKNLGI